MTTAAISFYNTAVNHVGFLGRNTIRNNIIVNYGAPSVRFFHGGTYAFKRPVPARLVVEAMERAGLVSRQA